MLCAALERELPDARFVVPEGGYFLWVDLPEGADVARLEELAGERGVVFVKGTDFLLEGGESSLRIAYSGVQADQIDDAVARLAGAYRDAGRRRGVNDGPGLDLGRRATLARCCATGCACTSRHLPFLLLMAAAIVVPVQLVVSGIGLEQLTAAYDDDTSAAETAIPTILTFFVTTPLVTAATIHALTALASGARAARRPLRCRRRSTPSRRCSWRSCCWPRRASAGPAGADPAGHLPADPLVLRSPGGGGRRRPRGVDALRRSGAAGAGLLVADVRRSCCC